jgi:group I intron endonuclease
MQRRWREHQSRLRAGRHHAIALQEAWNAYGEASFDFWMLQEVDQADNLVAAEAHWIGGFDSCGNGFNQLPAGGRAGSTMSAESRAKLSAARQGFRHTEEAKRKISEAGKRRAPISPETRARMSAAQRVVYSDPSLRARLSASLRAACAKPEVKRNKSAGQAGRVHSAETRRKISQAQIGRVHKPLPTDFGRRVSEGKRAASARRKGVS